jgi:hypothetical protein
MKTFDAFNAQTLSFKVHDVHNAHNIQQKNTKNMKKERHKILG